jgi:hypothetical protein
MTFKTMWGMITFVVAFVLILALAGCDPNGGDPGQISSFSGKVTAADVYESGGAYTRVTGTDYDGNYTYTFTQGRRESLSDLLNGPATIKIENGKLTIDLGTPKPESLYYDSRHNVEEIKNIDPNNTVKVSNPDAKVFEPNWFIRTDREFNLVCRGDGGIVWYYYYVDSDVTVSGSYSNDNGSGVSKNIYLLNLKKGWNYVKHTSVRGTNSGDWINTRETAVPGSDARWIVGVNSF